MQPGSLFYCREVYLDGNFFAFCLGNVRGLVMFGFSAYIGLLREGFSRLVGLWEDFKAWVDCGHVMGLRRRVMRIYLGDLWEDVEKWA
jgi:hypothetical protein